MDEFPILKERSWKCDDWRWKLFFLVKMGVGWWGDEELGDEKNFGKCGIGPALGDSEKSNVCSGF